MTGGCEEVRHFRELGGQELSEQRADIDAGKKVARAPGTLGSAGVVTGLAVIERALHERRDRQQLVVRNPQSAIRNLQSFLIVTNVSPDGSRHSNTCA